jgi:hypothetical protein
MKVFIVMVGERYEGSTIISAHKSKEGAIAAAMAVETFTGEGWLRTADDCWCSGGEWVEVHEWEVQK